MKKMKVTCLVNDVSISESVEPFVSVADFLRDGLGLFGTRLGCEYGSCGSCTVLIDGMSVRACLELAVRLEGSSVLTIEGLCDPEGPLSDVQEAFTENHALQCGYCTSGMLMTCVEYLNDGDALDENEIREIISGNLCRCTGYQGVVDAVLKAQKAKKSND